MPKNIGYEIAIYVAIISAVISGILSYATYAQGFEPYKYGGLVAIHALVGATAGALVALGYASRYYDDAESLDTMPYATRILMPIGIILALFSLAPCSTPSILCYMIATISYTGISWASAGLVVLLVWIPASSKAYYNATLRVLKMYHSEVLSLVKHQNTSS